ncbi:hypothetical protein KIPB_013863, partial [Kipferlia bialata]|eukprot:g13863.t1
MTTVAAVNVVGEHGQWVSSAWLGKDVFALGSILGQVEIYRLDRSSEAKQKAK